MTIGKRKTENPLPFLLKSKRKDAAAPAGVAAGKQNQLA
jgi:hypothetical protein